MKTNNLRGLGARAYQTGDENELVEFWDCAHAGLGGYVPKTPEYWRWCIIERPGVQPDDVLILESNNRIFAYAVLARNKGASGGAGIILEFAIAPWLSKRERKLVASKLIMVIEQRSRSRGDELLKLTVPSRDKVVVKVLEKAGYRAETLNSFQLVIVDLAQLLKQILNQRKTLISAQQYSSFRIAIKPGYYRFCPYQSLRIELGSEPVVEESLSGADYTVSTDLSTLTDIIFHRDSFNNALKNNDIQVSSKDSVEPVRFLFQLLALRGEWYLSPADGR